MMIKRDFNKLILATKLHSELTSWSMKVVGIMAWPDGSDSFSVLFNMMPTANEDIELLQIVNNHIPSDSLLNEINATDQKNEEGFALYKKIFAHISDNDAISNIDGFIAISGHIHTLRNFLKDGNFETSIRYMKVYMEPLGAFVHYDLYKGWILDLSKRWNPDLTDEMIAMIENAPDGAI